MIKKGLEVIVISFTLLIPALALAGQDAAIQLYEEAKAQYQKEEFEKAAALLDKAYQEDPKPVYQFNRILALQGAEKYEEALQVLKKHETAMIKTGEFDEVPDLKQELEQQVAESRENEPEAPEKKKASENKQEKEGVSPETVSDETTPPPSSDKDTKTVIGWSLIGTAGLFYGAAGFYGSYLPYNKDVTTRLKNGGTFNSAERQTFQTNKALSIGAMTLGTAALIGGGWLLLSKSESPHNTTLSIGPGNVAVGVRF